MNGKNFSKLVLIIIIAGVAITVGLLYTTESQTSDLYQAYLDRNIKVNQTANVHQNKPGDGDSEQGSETTIPLPGVPEHPNREETELENVDTSNYMDVAKYIARQFTGASCTSGEPHATPYTYSMSKFKDIDLCGSGTLSCHLDCSSLVSCIVKAIGKYSGARQTSSSIYNGGLTGWHIVSASTFADCAPGDVFVKVGHTAIIVAKDSDRVYFADAGSCRAISRTAQNGHSEAYLLSQSVSNWRSGSVRIYRK